MTNLELKEIMISATAIAKILAVDQLDTSKESAGVLLGRLEKETGTMIVTDIDTGKQQQTSTYVVMDDEALVQMVTNMQERGLEETILGWWHTHPGYGCFLSGTDKNTQRTYQNLFSEAVALVVDPLKYYNSGNQTDLDIQFFRLIDQLDYQPVKFSIFFDEVANHISNLSITHVKWQIPALSDEEVKVLHQKLESIKSPFLLDSEKQLVHTFVDVLNKSEEKTFSDEKDNKVLENIDNIISNINRKIEHIYHDENFKFYTLLNFISVIIIVIAWFLIVYFQ